MRERGNRKRLLFLFAVFLTAHLLVILFGVDTYAKGEAPRPSYDSQFVSQSVPQLLEPGKKYQVSLRFKNTGKNSWTAVNFFLVSQNPLNNKTWTISRVDLSPKEVVKTGQIKTFTFEITAPKTGGFYSFQWQMAMRVKGIFGEKSSNLTIRVNTPPVFEPVGDRTAFEDAPLRFHLDAEDKDPDNSLNFSASNLPQGATFDSSTKTFEWKPAHGQRGTYQNIHFEVSDGAAVVSQDISVTVKKTVVFGTIYRKNELGQNVGLENAFVEIMDIYRTRIFASAVTDATGHFDVFVESWQDGTYIIRASKPGYKSYSGAATLRSNSMMPFMAVLDEIATTIGPEGGIIDSADGRATLIIPPGALSMATAIRIIALSREAIEDLAPAGTTLLSVVECKPQGLRFLKPVTLIYHLEEAEVPGTPVALGLYDAAINEIRLVPEATSSVPSDGYTLTFSINGFSAYTALRNLTPQGIPIGGGVKIPLPDMFTGSFGHSIPIAIPPGRKGMQPALALNYRSSNANSWVGLGFSLNPGYIVRSSRLGPPTYDDIQDSFYLISDAGTTELVNLADNLYQAKIESSFTKFYKEADDTWRIIAKDGNILRFGEDAEAKEISASGTHSWYLTKAIDTNGNYVDYTYIKDGGKSYLYRIYYTGNTSIGTLPTNMVEFVLETRPDVLSSYISSARISTAKRLKEIYAYLNSELVWKYNLEYEESPDTSRSLLKSFVQEAPDGKTLPEQSLTYQTAR